MHLLTFGGSLPGWQCARAAACTQGHGSPGEELGRRGRGVAKPGKACACAALVCKQATLGLSHAQPLACRTLPSFTGGCATTHWVVFCQVCTKAKDAAIVHIMDALGHSPQLLRWCRADCADHAPCLVPSCRSSPACFTRCSRTATTCFGRFGGAGARVQEGSPNPTQCGLHQQLTCAGAPRQQPRGQPPLRPACWSVHAAPAP